MVWTHIGVYTILCPMPPSPIEMGHMREVHQMATKSFYEDLILDTPEAVANMGKAFERYEREGGYKVKGQVVLSTDKALLDRLLEKTRSKESANGPDGGGRA